MSVDGHGSAAPVTPRASPKPVLQSKRPARDKADGDDSSSGPALGCAAGRRTGVALATVQQLRLHMGMRHPHDVLQMVEMQRSELDQMQERFLGLPLAADEEHVSCLTIFTDGSASLDAAWP